MNTDFIFMGIVRAQQNLEYSMRYVYSIFHVCSKTEVVTLCTNYMLDVLIQSIDYANEKS